jgi:hypothetical protein
MAMPSSGNILDRRIPTETPTPSKKAEENEASEGY